MKKILNDKLFWIFFVLIAGVVFVASISNNGTYQAKVRILFLPRNEVAARNIDQIVENAKQIPLSLSFYNKIVELNRDIEDGALEMPNAERKEFWNAKIETRQVKKSGVLEVTILDASQLQAEIIAAQTTTGILTVMGNYYEVKNNLDMRVIDGPITETVSQNNYVRAIAVSLASGLLAGTLIVLFINAIVGFFVPEVPREKLALRSKTALFPKFSFPEMSMKKPLKTEKKENVFNFKLEDEVSLVQPIQPKKFSFFGTREKKASAPSNLPVGEEFNFKLTEEKHVSMETDLKEEVKSTAIPAEENEFVLDMGGAKKDNLLDMPEAAVAADSKREATPEEVKMRLNKLLSGGN